MSISATLPVSQRDQANAVLADAGFGPGNFSVPVYTGARPTYVTLHAWTDADFETAIAALPDVIISQIDGSPADRVMAAMPPGGQWGGNAPELAGQVTPGLYRDGDVLCWVVQPFDRDVYDQPLGTYPALVRKARRPGEATEWQQPLDQFDAYVLSEPFTGEPERVLHNGAEWVTTRDTNVWEPGTPDSGWVDVNATAPT